MTQTEVNYRQVIEDLKSGKRTEQYNKIEDTTVLLSCAESFEEIQIISKQSEPQLEAN